MASPKLPYVIQPTYVSFVYEGQTHTMNHTNPLYKQVVEALKARRSVKNFLSLALTAANQTQGKVRVEKDTVFYNGKPIHDSLAQRIIQLIEAGKNVSHMLIFMDRLYQNPNPESIGELFDLLDRSKTPITDDGCFSMYKVVKRRDGKLVDVYTGTVDNSVGQIVTMARKEVDHDRRRECSYGLHVCTLNYMSSFSGTNVIETKVDPRDVIAVPKDYNYAKMRVCRYEVIRELGKHADVKEKGSPDIEDSPLREVKSERQQVLRKLLKHRSIQRNIRLGRIAKSTLQKMTYGRLLKMWEPLKAATEQQKAGAVPALTLAQRARLFENQLGSLREAAGLTRRQVAEELDITYKAVWAAENTKDPSVDLVETYKTAIFNLGADRRTNVISISRKITAPRAQGAWDQVAV